MLKTPEPTKVKSSPFLLKTQQVVKRKGLQDQGIAFTVDKNNFPILDGVTCYTLEMWEECMRLPHWHPNATELGYVVSGSIEVLMWRSPGESTMFTLTAGMCWFIPQAALHSLNNVGKTPAKLLVGFSSELPLDIDLPVAFNGIPAPLRDAYTTPHEALRKWQGVVENPLFGRFHMVNAVNEVVTGSPYLFDLGQMTPLFDQKDMGSVVWTIKSNWDILQNISLLRAHLKPGTARDAIWYPDAGTLYVVTQGQGEFHIIPAGQEPVPLQVGYDDYIFVPAGFLHTFINKGKNDFEVIAFFNKENPLPEISLSVSTGFFPRTLRGSSLLEYGSRRDQKQKNPLEHLNFTKQSPYLVRTEK
jgi:oxalate decarboxylase